MDLKILMVIAVAALVLAVVNCIRIFVVGRRTGRECRQNTEVVSRIQSAWDAFSAREIDERRRLGERADQFRNDVQARWEAFSGREEGERERLTERVEKFENVTRSQVRQMEEIAGRTRGQIDQLEGYIKDFFEAELKSVFRSFDKTVGSVLGEMKSELLRGVRRIDEIQAVVNSKGMAEERVAEGESAAFRLLTETSEGAAKPGVQEAAEEPLSDTREGFAEEAGLPTAKQAGGPEPETSEAQREEEPAAAVEASCEGPEAEAVGARTEGPAEGDPASLPNYDGGLEGEEETGGLTADDLRKEIGAPAGDAEAEPGGAEEPGGADATGDDDADEERQG